MQDDDQKARGSDQASQFCDLDRIKSHASQCIGKQSNDPPQAAGCKDGSMEPGVYHGLEFDVLMWLVVFIFISPLSIDIV